MKQIEIKETDSRYFITNIEEEYIFVQRKHPLAAIDSPMKPEEEIICHLCKAMLAGE